jgi:hypothetical protein
MKILEAMKKQELLDIVIELPATEGRGNLFFFFVADI